MDRLGIEFISVFGLPPVDFVNLAADLGCRNIGMALEPMPPNPHTYPAWSLRDNAALRRDMLSAMADRGVSISLGEGFIIWPDKEVDGYAGDLDVMGELGVRRINMLSVDPDLNRSFDQFAALVEMADKIGMETTLEYAPIMAIPDLDTAIAAIRHVGRPSFRLLIDLMHFVRAGAGAEEAARLDPDLIGYIQLCDAPREFTIEGYADEARYERMVPGTGDLPLAEILAALPRDRVVGLEVPMLREAEAGVGPFERLSRCVGAARSLLDQIAE